MVVNFNLCILFFFFFLEFMVSNWFCNFKEIIIVYLSERNEICFYGSGYGGNLLLGKKCFVFRFGLIFGRREGWFVEYMLVNIFIYLF